MYFLNELNMSKGIKFTSRELDIIACIVNNKSTKKIALILSISPRTVEVYVSNILSKISMNSRESIIDFVETYENFQTINDRYLNLIVEKKFLIILGKIKLAFLPDTKCFFDLKYCNLQKKKSLKKFLKYLNVMGFKNSKKLEPISLANSRIFTLYPIFDKEVNIIEKDLNFEKEQLIQTSIFLSKNVLQTSEILKHKNCIYFENYNTYHELFFDIISLIMPKESFLDIFINFYKEFPSTERNFENSKLGPYVSLLHQFPVEKQKDTFCTLEKKGTFFIGIIKYSSEKWNFFNKNFFFNNLKDLNKRKISLILLFSLIYMTLQSYYPYLMTHSQFFWNTLHEKRKQFFIRVESLEDQNYLTHFNLPRLIENYTDRPQLTAFIKSKFLENTNHEKKNIIVSLYGLGGIGKTTLATNIIHNPIKNYTFRVWFNAETEQSLKANYITLGEKLKLFSSQISDNIKISIVKSWLEKKRDIFAVYDNLEDLDLIKKYVPLTGHTLITSTNYGVPGSIEVDVMEKKEALLLLNSFVPDKIKSYANYEKISQKLIHVLGFLPLAISQAGSYIKETEITISNYLDLYQDKKNQILSEVSSHLDCKDRSIYIAWNLSIEKIKNIPDGENALALLDFCSYCHFNNIPRKILMQYLFNKEHKHTKEIVLNKAIKVLRQYSLVKVSPDSISMHPLVHEWVKNQHKNIHRTSIIKRSIKTIKAIYPMKRKTKEEIEFTKHMVPHLVSFYKLGAPFFERKDSMKLALILADAFETIRHFENSNIFLKKAFFLSQKCFGNNHINTANILQKIGIIDRHLGNYKSSIINLKVALQAVEKHYGPEHFETARILHNIGWTYDYLGYYSKSSTLLEKSWNIMQKHFVSDSIEKAHILCNLAWSYFRMGNFLKSKDFSKKALCIEKKHYGANNFPLTYSLHILAWNHLLLGEKNKAKILFEKIVFIREKKLGIYSEKLAYALCSLGISNCYLGEYSNGKDNFIQALNIIEKQPTLDQCFKIKLLANMGNNYRLMNKLDLSKQLLEQSLKSLCTFYDEQNINVALIKANLGLLYSSLGNMAKAEDYLSQSYEIMKKHFVPTHPYMKAIFKNIENVKAGRTEDTDKLGFFLIF